MDIFRSCEQPHYVRLRLFLKGKGKICEARCRVCFEVDGRDNLLVPKPKNLHKHASRRHVIETVNKKGEYYWENDISNVINEDI